jgi:hypothetical protein
MPNTVLPDTYLERVERLALGLEPRDAVRALTPARPLHAVFDGVPGASAHDLGDLHGLDRTGAGLSSLSRRSGGRFAILQRPGLETSIGIRFFDAKRRFVPRRLRYPIPEDASESRVRRPLMFPGAAYDVSYTATGLRGRVTRGAGPDAPAARWVRVVASVGGSVVGRAHGDDRGEFLLLLGSNANGPGQLRNPLVVSVTVFGPPSAPVPPDPSLPDRDPLWDLPDELAPSGDPDDVSSGAANPPAYTTSIQRDVTFIPGRLRSDEGTFVLTP